jgi:hypothetical protein
MVLRKIISKTRRIITRAGKTATIRRQHLCEPVFTSRITYRERPWIARFVGAEAGEFTGIEQCMTNAMTLERGERLICAITLSDTIKRHGHAALTESKFASADI